MLSSHCFACLAVLSFQIVFDWKLLLTRLLRLVSLAHQSIKLLVSLAQEKNLLALGNGTHSIA